MTETQQTDTAQENERQEEAGFEDYLRKARLAEEATRVRSQAAELKAQASRLHREAETLSVKARDLSQKADQLTGIRNSPSMQRQAKMQKEAVERVVHGLFRDVLATATEGKLRLCETAGDLPAVLALPCDPIPLTQAGGLRELRQQAKQEAIGLGLTGERWQDFVTACQEAGMNAVVHAGGGTSRISTNDRDTIQVRVEDRGSGIEVERLPRALLKKGYSTAGTFGHGMKMMIAAADRIWLLTGLSGTVVVLEQDRITPEPFW